MQAARKKPRPCDKRKRRTISGWKTPAKSRTQPKTDKTGADNLVAEKKCRTKHFATAIERKLCRKHGKRAKPKQASTREQGDGRHGITRVREKHGQTTTFYGFFSTYFVSKKIMPTGLTRDHPHHHLMPVHQKPMKIKQNTHLPRIHRCQQGSQSNRKVNNRPTQVFS